MERSEEGGAAPEIDWEEVRRVYEAREATVGAILAEFGITAYQLHKARLTGGWTARPQIATPGPNQGRGAIYARSLLRRLLRVVAEMLKAREAAGGEAISLPEVTLLAALIKIVEGAMYMDMIRRGHAPAGPRRGERKTNAVGGGFATPEEARAADVAFMRAEIKRKIAILRRSAGLDGEDRQPEGG